MQVLESAISQTRAGEQPPQHGRWYAVHARSNFEKRIAGELSARGLENYLPALEETHQWKDRRQRVAVPLFPGYVFARFLDSAEARLSVLKTTGVVRILGQGSALEAIPDEQIAAVRTILEARVPAVARPLLRKGASVRVVRGALRGLEGTLERDKKQARLVIALPLLNQSIAAEVSARDVELVKPAPARKVRT